MNTSRIRKLVKAAIRTEVIYSGLMREFVDSYFKEPDKKVDPVLVAKMFGMMFKWPDVVVQMLDLMDGKDVWPTLTKDIETIITIPLTAIMSSYNEMASLNKADRAEIDQKITDLQKIDDVVDKSNSMIELLNHMADKSSTKLPKIPFMKL